MSDMRNQLVSSSFLIASPMVNEVALVMLWGLFGWKIALLYIATGVTIAIIAGILIGKLGMEKYVEAKTSCGFCWNYVSVNYIYRLFV